MNYQAIYDNLILKARSRSLEEGVYFERHHVIPRCLGGTDDLENLVSLTAEEHYVAHQLLVKIHPDNSKLLFAAIGMSWHPNGNRVNNKVFGWLRKKASESQKGVPKSEESRRKMSEAKKGRPALNKGTKASEETKIKQSAAKLGKPRKPFSEETLQRMSKAQKGKTSWAKGTKQSPETIAKRIATRERNKLLKQQVNITL